LRHAYNIFFALGIFWMGISYLCLGGPGLQSCLLFLCNWDDRQAPSYPAFIGWDGGLASNWAPPHLCLLSSWDYGQEQVWLASVTLPLAQGKWLSSTAVNRVDKPGISVLFLSLGGNIVI
jgi:hypothetical protein